MALSPGALRAAQCAVFCAATSIGVAFTQWSGRIHWLYQGDLLGAGGGALSIVLALFLFPLSTCLRLVSLLGFVAAALACRQWVTPQWLPLLLLGGGGLLASMATAVAHPATIRIQGLTRRYGSRGNGAQ